MNNLPIGIFDSGIGGITVLKELIRFLPGESFIYFGDTARVPYGSKSPRTIKLYASQITQFLLSKNIKILIIACNTVSAIAIDEVKKIANVPIFEVITPPSKEAIRVTKNKRIGIIGTKRTILSSSYQKCLLSMDPSVKLFAKPTPLLVPLIEEGLLSEKITYEIVDFYLSDFKNKIDTLILGCTHYPMLQDIFKSYFENKVNIISSAKTVAMAVKNYLEKNNLFSIRKEKFLDFYVSDPISDFSNLAPKFLGFDIPYIRSVDLAELYL